MVDLNLGFEIDDEDRVDYKKAKINYLLSQGKFLDERKREVNPENSLIVDPASEEPREQQIRRRITEICRNQNVRRYEMVSMEEMTDMIAIGKEFGQIPLGNQADRSLEKYGKFSQFQPNPINRNWYNISKFLNFGPTKM